MTRGVACALLGLLLGVFGCDGEALPARPHLILISIDTLRQDALRAFSPQAPELPALDGFAEESARFPGALSPAGWTLPAHAALLTGLYPDRAGGTHRHVPLADDAPRLAEVLRAAGYATLAFTDGGYVDGRFGFARGFDRYDARSQGGPRLGTLPRGGAPTQRPGAALFDRAVAALTQLEANGPPLFLFLQTYSLHDYFYERPWAAQALGTRTNRERGARTNLACLVGAVRCPSARWERLRAFYRAELAHVDEGFARLLATLRHGGWLERSVVVVLSDHGEGFEPEAGRIHHGGRLDPDLLAIPLLFRGPGIAPGTREGRVSLIDVAPTLLELAGARVPESLEGRSLLPALRDPWHPTPARPLLAMEHFHYWEDGLRRAVDEPPPEPLAFAVVEGDLWWQRGRAGEPAGEGERVRALRRLAEARIAAGSQAGPSAPLDADLRARLEALGYLDTEAPEAD